MRGSLSIRKAEGKDASFCLDVQASREDSTFSEQDYLNSISNPNAIFLVAEHDRRAIGFILGFIVPTKNAEAIIHSTMVHASYSHRGIGSNLVRRFVEIAFEGGVQEIFAEVEEGPDKFYEKCGFRKVAMWHSMRLKKRNPA